MADYISREAFITKTRKQYCADCDRRKGMKNGKMRFCYDIGEAPCRACSVDDMLNDVEDFPAAFTDAQIGEIPAADVVEVRHGEWVDKRHKMTGNTPCCSVCGGFHTIETKFCPNCGAKMDGGADDDQR
jgi:membrane protease subunit (stomatin/prohibitin family)